MGWGEVVYWYKEKMQQGFPEQPSPPCCHSLGTGPSPAVPGKLLPTYSSRVQPGLCPRSRNTWGEELKLAGALAGLWAGLCAGLCAGLSWDSGGWAVFLNHLPQPLGEVEISSHREESLQRGRGSM